MQLEISENNKWWLVFIMAIVLIIALAKFLVWDTYGSLKLKKQERVELDNRIQQSYQTYLQGAKEKILLQKRQPDRNATVTSSQLFELLTTKPLFGDLAFRFLDVQEDKQREDRQQYTFKLELNTGYRRLYEYLHFLESSSPLIFINDLEIRPWENNPNVLKITLSGTIAQDSQLELYLDSNRTFLEPCSTATASKKKPEVKTDTLRNPFLAGMETKKNLTPKGIEADLKDITLSGIIGNGKERKALINGNLYRPGDLVLGMTIDYIGERTVILKRREQSYTLHLEERQ